MTNPDPFAGISKNERAALDYLAGRSVLLSGDVQRIAFLHNASFNRVRSLLPSYRQHKEANARAVETLRHAAGPALAPDAPKSEATAKPRKWPRLRK